MHLLTQLLSKILKLVATFTLCLVSAAALAHTALKTSNPADGAVINHAPQELHLTFTAAVALVRFSITDQTEKQLELDFEPVTDAQTEYAIVLPVMPMGHYKVEWAAIGADGHTVSNSFAFAIDPSAEPGEGSASSQGQHGH
jgi:methionine-rich copper-binding protein CopC